MLSPSAYHVYVVEAKCLAACEHLRQIFLDDRDAFAVFALVARARLCDPVGLLVQGVPIFALLPFSQRKLPPCQLFCADAQKQARSRPPQTSRAIVRLVLCWPAACECTLVTD
jgi:hypothetical protein